VGRTKEEGLSSICRCWNAVHLGQNDRAFAQNKFILRVPLFCMMQYNMAPHRFLIVTSLDCVLLELFGSFNIIHSVYCSCNYLHIPTHEHKLYIIYTVHFFINFISVQQMQYTFTDFLPLHMFRHTLCHPQGGRREFTIFNTSNCFSLTFTTHDCIVSIHNRTVNNTATGQDRMRSNN
jgi:hypothetical protein